MKKETRIKCDTSYNRLLDRRGILPEDAKSSVISKIARFYDSLENPYVWICENGVQKLCYLESIAMYREDAVHEQLYDDISGPGKQWERVHLALQYKENNKIVECYRYFKVNILGEMNETFFQLIEESDVRIPNQYDLSHAEYDEGIPVYRKTGERVEERRKDMESNNKSEIIDLESKNQKEAVSEKEGNFMSMFKDVLLAEKHFFWRDYETVNTVVLTMRGHTCGVFGTAKGRRNKPWKDIVKEALSRPYVKDALKKKKKYYLLVSGPTNLIEVNEMMHYLEKKVGNSPEIMWFRTGSVSKLYAPKDQEIAVTIYVID